MSEDGPSFDVPARPARRFTATGSVEYEGETVFSLSPTTEGADDQPPEIPVGELDSLVTSVLDTERYIAGDWFDLPRPVYLVYDSTASTTFRVVVRHGRVELHLLPDTDADGLQAFYDRLVEASDRGAWTVDCRTTSP
jgi:hypothetical protein